MKYVILWTAIILLCIPPIVLGCINWLWKPNKKGFTKGAQWLDDQFDYGNFIDNLVEEAKS